jgi:hypothetical protein
MRHAASQLAACLLLVTTLSCASAGTSAGDRAATVSHTITGEVLSFTSDQVQLRTEDGESTVALAAETLGRSQLMVGSRVAIDYDRTTPTGLPLAVEIRRATSGGG